MSERADVLLYRLGLAPSRQKAREMIEGGLVFLDGEPVQKPGEKLAEDAVFKIRGEVLPFVGRGGLKLQKALETWPIDLAGRTCVDAGASTGGFTDCMLQHGAAKVFAVDVGTGQLHEKRKNDSRVVNLEKTDIRDLSPEHLPDPIGFVSVDVSFISLSYVLPAVYRLLQEGGEAVALIKPQFEAGRALVGKKGVVKDPKVHLSVLKNTVSLAESLSFSVLGLTWSPVRGPEGNIEYLIRLKKGGESAPLPDLRALVEGSHKNL